MDLNNQASANLYILESGRRQASNLSLIPINDMRHAQLPKQLNY